MDISLEIETLEKVYSELEEQKGYITAVWHGDEAKAFIEKYDVFCEMLRERLSDLRKIDE